MFRISQAGKCPFSFAARLFPHVVVTINHTSLCNLIDCCRIPRPPQADLDAIVGQEVVFLKKDDYFRKVRYYFK